MRKLIPAVLIAAGAVGAGLAWRAATEESRRYSALLEVVRLNEKGDGGAWSERDAALFWEQLLWFRDRAPWELTRRILESLEERDRPAEAARLALGMRQVEREADTERMIRHSELFPDHLIPEGKGFSADPFRLAESILAKSRAVDTLADHAGVVGSQALLQMVMELDDPPAHVWPALRRVVEQGPHPPTRLSVLASLAVRNAFRDAPQGLVRLTADPEPAVRVAALAELARLGNAQAARELVFSIRRDAHVLHPNQTTVPLIRFTNFLGGGRYTANMIPVCVDREGGGADRVWEFAERVGNALERRAVGERGPLDPE